MCLQCVSLVRLIVATRSSGPPASGKIVKEMPGSVASGTSYILCAGYCEFCRYLIAVSPLDRLIWSHLLVLLYVPPLKITHLLAFT